jgi:ATP-binding cassette subfamily B protein
VKRYLPLLRYARPHWRSVVVLVATMFVDVGLDVLQPWPLKLIVDDVLGHHRPPAVVTSLLPGTQHPHTLALWAALATIAIFLLGTASSTFYNYLSLKIGQCMVFDLAADVFAHLQRLSLRFHNRHSTGDLISRVTGDAYCVSTLVTDALIPAVQALVMLAAMFAVMWSLQPTLTLVSLAVVPFLAAVVRFMSNPIHERAREQRDNEAEMVSVVEQTLAGLPAVQAFAREEIEEERFRHWGALTVRSYLRSTVAGIWFEGVAGVVTTVGTAGIIYLGADLALRGKLTAGTIIVFLSYLRSLYDPLDSITHTGQTVQGAAAEADRVLEILDAEPEITDRPTAIPLAVAAPVAFEGVTFGYRSGAPVLRGVSLAAEPGQMVAIVGPTGAGKTTLVNLLVRFYDPWEGRVTIGGRDLRDLQLRSLRQQVAMVLQDPFLFPISIAENIAYGRTDATRAEIRAAAQAARADDFIVRLPDGYDTEVEERGANLSGGERQRLAIARAFLKDAPILILDEPTSALDAHTEQLLLEALEDLMVGRITFVIAHRLSTIQRADRIAVLDQGVIVEQGTHEELIGLGGRYADLYLRQMTTAVMAHREAPLA